MNSSVALSGLLLVAFGSYVSLPVTKIVSPLVNTGLMLRRMDKYGALPLKSKQPLDFVEHFATVLEIGTPKPQKQSFIIDSGERLTFIPCNGVASSCNYNEYFNFKCSDTFQWNNCSTCNGGFDIFCQTNEECNFSMSDTVNRASGRIFTDMVDFGWGPLQMQMGCAMNVNGGVISDQVDGVLGLGISQNISVVFQIGQQLRSVQVAHCFKNSGRGTLIFGEWQRPKEMHWVPLNTEHNHYYKVKTLSIWVGNMKVSDDNRLEMNQFHGTVWDTGSPHMWMPNWLYKLS